MTTNHDRAAEVLGRERYSRSLQSAPDVLGRLIEHSRPDAQALADAGLLTPDALPPQYLYDDWGVWPINAHPDHHVVMRVTGTGRRLVEMYAPVQMEPLTALRLAAALIEAATLATQEKK